MLTSSATPNISHPRRGIAGIEITAGLWGDLWNKGTIIPSHVTSEIIPTKALDALGVPDHSQGGADRSNCDEGKKLHCLSRKSKLHGMENPCGFIITRFAKNIHCPHGT